MATKMLSWHTFNEMFWVFWRLWVVLRWRIVVCWTLNTNKTNKQSPKALGVVLWPDTRRICSRPWSGRSPWNRPRPSQSWTGSDAARSWSVGSITSQRTSSPPSPRPEMRWAHGFFGKFFFFLSSSCISWVLQGHCTGREVQLILIFTLACS